ncbi:MAG TPA: hypothetical protein VKE70_19465 [Candidatus Solibacter sp.]|nr:hypothetical protein [Candidatus Solibacter sp.]
MISRRDMLGVALLSQSGFGQTGGQESVTRSGSGLRLERQGDPSRPAVAIFIPGQTAPAAKIEMPEHAWRKEGQSGEQLWFYRMYTSDAATRGTVQWSRTEDTLSYSMQTPSGFVLKAGARLEADGVSITYEVQAPSREPLATVEAPTCVKLYRPFTDVFLERTFVHHPTGLDLIASETPERLSMNAEEWLPIRYIVPVGRDAAGAQGRRERLDGVTRYFKSRAADVAFIATESQPKGWVAATHGLGCPSLFTNPARTCHHADPRVEPAAEGRAQMRLKVYMVRGSLQELWPRVAGRDRAGEV